MLPSVSLSSHESQCFIEICCANLKMRSSLLVYWVIFHINLQHSLSVLFNLLQFDIHFRLRYGLVNSINAYLRLKIYVLGWGFLFLIDDIN